MKTEKHKDKLSKPDDIKAQVKARADKEKQEYSGQEKNKQDDGKDKSPYFIKGGYLCRTKYTKEGGEVTVPLCNFSARITEENIIDDGQDSQHLFTIEGKLFDKIPLQKIEIPADKFQGLTWVSKWGSRCCLEPGQTIRDFIRHAVQKASPDAPVSTHYGHLGWRLINGQWCYLHAGGAIGCAENVSVRLTKELERYTLPPFPLTQTESANLFRDNEKKGLQTSLSFLDIGNRAVTMPLWCMVFLAPLTTILNPMPNFSQYIFGQSGTFKTTIAILAIAHYGNFTGVDGLSNFEDTKGMLEVRGFKLKDSLQVLDDYHPSSNRKASESKEAIAQAMIRAYSNRTARGRLNSDLTEKGRYEPRGMMVMTAEEQPTLESTLARVCIIEVTEGAIDRNKLTAIQKDAASLPYAMSSYIAWIRDNMAEIRETFPARFRELRERAATEGFHKKLPEQAAFMGFALETATSFFNEKGVLSNDAGAALVSEGWEIFRKLAARQQQRISADDPVALFFNILSTLITLGQARLDRHPHRELSTIGTGELIGWYNNDNPENAYMLLMPEVIDRAVRKYCRDSDIHFPFSKDTFWSMLKNRKIIQTKNDGKTGIKASINNIKKHVLKVIDADVLRQCGVLKLSDTEEEETNKDI
ncbi:MAG: TOPRIM domain-containing protein [Syntrophaceae bacterium]|nr:MAG: TOPRIM domain-containing protein [Syntrophaceae bacterium]